MKKLKIMNENCTIKFHEIHFFIGTGCITKNELKFFYTAFMDAGKLGDQKLEEFTNNAFEMLTSVSKITDFITFFVAGW